MSAERLVALIITIFVITVLTPKFGIVIAWLLAFGSVLAVIGALAMIEDSLTED